MLYDIGDLVDNFYEDRWTWAGMLTIVVIAASVTA